MLLGKDGLSICRDVRSPYHGPILILTAKEDDMDQVAGLELGVDDYVKKSVDPRVLLERIRDLFRRSSPITVFGAENREESRKKIKFRSLEIDYPSRNVRLANEVVDLSTSEFDLL
jgi:two-component system, OmpR family, response regulator RstA